jgi:hypothetical protein
MADEPGEHREQLMGHHTNDAEGLGLGPERRRGDVGDSEVAEKRLRVFRDEAGAVVAVDDFPARSI